MKKNVNKYHVILFSWLCMVQLQIYEHLFLLVGCICGILNVICCSSDRIDEDGNSLIHQNDSHIEPSGNHPAQTSGEVLQSNDTKQHLPGVAGDWWLACKTVLISFGISFVYKLLSEWVSMHRRLWSSLVEVEEF